MTTLIKVNQSASPRKEPIPQGRPSHHVDDNHSEFVNPWDSWPSMSLIDASSNPFSSIDRGSYETGFSKECRHNDLGMEI